MVKFDHTIVSSEDVMKTQYSNYSFKKIFSGLKKTYEYSQKTANLHSKLRQDTNEEDFYYDLEVIYFDIIYLAEYFCDEYEKNLQYLSEEKPPSQFLTATQGMCKTAREFNKQIGVVWNNETPEDKKWKTISENYYRELRDYVAYISEVEEVIDELMFRLYPEVKDSSEGSAPKDKILNLKWDSDEGILQVNQTDIEFTKDTKEFDICNYLIVNNKIKEEGITFDEILEIQGHGFDDTRKLSGSYYQACRRVNSKVGQKTTFSNFLDYTTTKAEINTTNL